jgi:hypothetical protein
VPGLDQAPVGVAGNDGRVEGGDGQCAVAVAAARVGGDAQAARGDRSVDGQAGEGRRGVGVNVLDRVEHDVGRLRRWIDREVGKQGLALAVLCRAQRAEGERRQAGWTAFRCADQQLAGSRRGALAGPAVGDRDRCVHYRAVVVGGGFGRSRPDDRRTNDAVAVDRIDSCQPVRRLGKRGVEILRCWQTRIAAAKHVVRVAWRVVGFVEQPLLQQPQVYDLRSAAQDCHRLVAGQVNPGKQQSSFAGCRQVVVRLEVLPAQRVNPQREGGLHVFGVFTVGDCQIFHRLGKRHFAGRTQDLLRPASGDGVADRFLDRPQEGVEPAAIDAYLADQLAVAGRLFDLQPAGVQAAIFGCCRWPADDFDRAQPGGKAAQRVVLAGVRWLR